MKTKWSLRVVMAVCVMLSLRGNAADESEKITYDLALRLGGESGKDTVDKKEISSWRDGLIGVEGRLGLKPSPLYLELNGYIDGISERGTFYGGDANGRDLDYTGSGIRMKLEADVGLRIGNSDISLTPFVGLGVRSTRWGDPDPNFLHIESWTGYYCALGFRFDANIDKAKLFARCAIQPSLKETVSIEGEDADLDKKTTVMGDAELGIVIGHFRISAFGELFRYDSDRATAIDRTASSEQIKIATFGGTIGVNF